ncbi:xylulokinase [Thermoflavimicrobium dichotomicum]|uniref:Xylulose kinase n=1 Tax=Thermoflavimicrobium dichotomicum TaxID=46223 RepID=A0A1I3V155_9BACL|nr:xylulokinase [Thermoflavimicrobium dichotomicum]SFJ88842.1 xylulokinase [Thermoflavimicrobium dichotomicum]
MPYVLGIDIGTSAVKAILVNEQGHVCQESSVSYPLSQPQFGYSEQDPEAWVQGTIKAVQNLLHDTKISPADIQGLSLSGQMHSLVLLDQNHRVLRPAILWNDTRTTAECQLIEQTLGKKLLAITQNRALEGFTLPKLLWVKNHEPHIWEQATSFLLPKDYVRFRLTGQLAMDLSDAAGTLLLDLEKREWSPEICSALDIPLSLCPRLVTSQTHAGNLREDIAQQMGLTSATRVFAGGADNACGAVGAGILSHGRTMCSIGTSGVILSYLTQLPDVKGKLHLMNHAQEGSYYAMGVTLAAGYSLQWFKEQFAQEYSFDDIMQWIDQVPAGADGLLFTPYLVGERTPHADADIRGSFIGIHAAHTRAHFARSVVEGITFSLKESLTILQQAGQKSEHIVSIGGGAKSETWLQLQADIFGIEVVKLDHEQGPALGAAMLAAVGCGWFDTLDDCASNWLKPSQSFSPDKEKAKRYEELFAIYQEVYANTREINQQLRVFRG